MPEFASAFPAILLMGLVNYGTKLTGYLIARRLRSRETLQQIFETLPGCAIMALFAPIAIKGDPVDLLALGLTVILHWVTGNVLLATVTGLATLMSKTVFGF